MILWTVAHQAPLSTGFSRPEYWSGLPCPPPGDLPNPETDPVSMALQSDSLPLSHQGSPSVCVCVCVCVCVYVHVRACVSCSVVSNSFRPTDYSPPGSFVHGISQARILEWVAISFSRRSSWPRDWTWVSCIADRLFTINQLFSNKIEKIIKMSNSPLPLPKYLFPTTRKKND